MYRSLIFLIVSILLISFKSDKPAYYIFDKSGDKVKFADMVDELKNADIILFGELHDNPIAHWLQFELTKSLFDSKGNKLVLSAEMFESDNQLIMDEYLGGIISESKFEAEARLWPNYKTDYKPLVNFAKTNSLKFLASNIPRRYASLVFSKGFEGLESLSPEAKKLIAPLPVDYDVELNCYKSMLTMGENGMHANENLPKAQAIKDATMTYFILKEFSGDKLVLHFNGAYHSDDYESMVWYLKKANPNLKIKTISTQMQDDIETINDEYVTKADFIIIVPQSMTRTH